MAVSIMMVSDPESEQELAESHLMLKNNSLCFRMSSSFVGNNPSLQIHCQTTQAWLAMSELPQPLVDLMHIASTPAICSSCVSTAHGKA
jgi:hypothetical protein